jgi:site-specific DNA-methyltransferase (adenine-specific)
MFSFAGDTVLDPFAGIGSTNLAALGAGRNSIGNEIDSIYLRLAHSRLIAASDQTRLIGATRATVHYEDRKQRYLKKSDKIALSVARPLPQSV